MMALVLATLAIWRLTSLLVYEDGPFNIFDRLRDAPPLQRLLGCFWCTSVWTAAVIVAMVRLTFVDRIILWLAASAGAILIEEFRCRK